MVTKKFNKKRFQNNMIPWLFLGPAIIILFIVILFPVLKVINYSFHENMFNNDNPAFVFFDNYKAVLQDDRFVKMLIFTTIFTIVSVFLHIVLGLLFAVFLNKKINPAALLVFRVIFVLPWVFTVVVVAVLWQLMLTPQGVINTALSMISGQKVMIDWIGQSFTAPIALFVINAWRGYPTCMVSFLTRLQKFSADIYDAADVDGCGKFRQFFSITLPQLKPVILRVGILDAIWTLNLFPLIWLTTGGGPSGSTETIATLTYRLSFVEFNFGQASALAVIGLLLITIGVISYMKVQNKFDY